jgi:RNA polymerase sigma-70 factor (ECF subfamily)
MGDTLPGQASGYDALLLAQVVQGEVVALEKLFLAYQERVYQLAVGITRDAETAEEVVQDTFYRLYLNARRIDPNLPLLPWLYRVAANLSYNCARAHRRWSSAVQRFTDSIRDSSGSSPEWLAEQHELQTIVRQTLDSLPPRHRAVLVLHYVHDYNIVEIAAILNCPQGTVKSRLYHARKLLRDQLEQHYGFTAPLLPDIV